MSHKPSLLIQLHRKSIAAKAIATPPVNDILSDNNDDFERSFHNQPTEDSHNSSLRVYSTIEKYSKIFNSNKVNHASVWQTDAIHEMSDLVHMKKTDAMKCGATALGVCRKLFIIRVDAVWLQAMNCSSDLNTQANQSIVDDDVNDVNEANDDATNESEEEDQPKAKKKKTYKRKNTTRVAQTQLAGQADVVFIPQSLLSSALTDNPNSSTMLFQSFLPLMPDTYKFLLIDNDLDVGVINSCETNPDKYKFPTQDVVDDQYIPKWSDFTNMDINPQLQDFSLTTYTDKDLDIECMDKTLNNSLNVDERTNMEFFYDENVVDASPLEQSHLIDVPDTNDMNASIMNESIVENVHCNQANQARTLAPKLAFVSSMAPIVSARASEYIYNVAASNEIWYGPSHWKYKPVNTRACKPVDVKTCAQKHSQKKVPKKINYTETVAPVNEKLIERKQKNTKHTNVIPSDVIKLWESDLHVLPEDLEITELQLMSYTLATDLQIPVTQTHHDNVMSDVNDEVDASVCALNATLRDQFDNDVPEMDNNDADDMFHEETANDGHMLDEQNLVAVPQTANVELNLLKYEKQARTVNLKRVKRIIMHELNRCESLNLSKVYASVTKQMPTENASVGSVFFALLQCANEHNLSLRGVNGFGDVQILSAQ